MRGTRRQPSGGHERHIATGAYVVLDPPHRFVKTWQWEQGGGGTTQLSVSLRDVGNDRTEITLVHEHFTDDVARKSHADGWASTLNRLETYLSTHF